MRSWSRTNRSQTRCRPVTVQFSLPETLSAARGGRQENAASNRLSQDDRGAPYRHCWVHARSATRPRKCQHAIRCCDGQKKPDRRSANHAMARDLRLLETMHVSCEAVPAPDYAGTRIRSVHCNRSRLQVCYRHTDRACPPAIGRGTSPRSRTAR